MSGHSKWKTIKHKKSLTDAKRGKAFSKLAMVVAIAARKGADPAFNFELRQAVEKAKAANMPQDNIERAIKKGSGESGGAQMEELTYEAYGPGGAALIITAITDNKNRTAPEIKFILSQHNGKFAEAGSVGWMFEKKGVISLTKPTEKSKDDLEMTAIEAGAENTLWEDDILEIYTAQEKLEEIKTNLINAGLKPEESSLDFVAKNLIEITDEKSKAQLEKLYEALDENDDVQEIYSNVN